MMAIASKMNTEELAQAGQKDLPLHSYDRPWEGGFVVALVPVYAEGQDMTIIYLKDQAPQLYPFKVKTTMQRFLRHRGMDLSLLQRSSRGTQLTAKPIIVDGKHCFIRLSMRPDHVGRDFAYGFFNILALPQCKLHLEDQPLRILLPTGEELPVYHSPSSFLRKKGHAHRLFQDHADDLFLQWEHLWQEQETLLRPALRNKWKQRMSFVH